MAFLHRSGKPKKKPVNIPVCLACGKLENGPFHEESCKKCSKHHIKLHDLMVAYIIKKTKNRLGSKLVTSENHCTIPNIKKKPDIWL